MAQCSLVCFGILVEGQLVLVVFVILVLLQDFRHCGKLFDYTLVLLLFQEVSNELGGPQLLLKEQRSKHTELRQLALFLIFV